MVPVLAIKPPPSTTSPRSDASLIDVAQRAGLSLDEIRELLEHGNNPMSERLRELAVRQSPDIDAPIERVQRVRSWLQTAQSRGS